MVRGIRGAITASANESTAITAATHRLLREIIDRNAVEIDDIAAVFFTTTPDLNAEFPAAAARTLGWEQVALLCGHEMAVPSALARCIRVLVLVNTPRSQDDVRHVYLDGAASLRPDLATTHVRKTDST